MLGTTKESQATAAMATTEDANGDDSSSLGLEGGGDGLAESSHFNSTSSGSGGGAADTKRDNDSAAAIRKQLSKRESKNVFRLRLVVLLVFLTAAALVSAIVYSLTVQGEKDEFEEQYDGAAGKVIESFEDIMNKMGSVSGLGSAYTSYGEDHSDHSGDAEWPFVSLNSFQQKASHARHLSGALLVSMNPIVEKKDFEAWDNYVAEPDHTAWM